jgi:NADH dehydrogenase [ubiquinone] 1 alpha subcomplex assembly factor 7
LMQDIWRGLSAMPAMRDKASIHLIEFSPRLQKIQSENLVGLPVTWHSDLTSVPKVPSLIIANEFFDALPVEQAVYHDGMWYQRLVAAEEEDLIVTLGKPLQGIAVDNPEDGAIFEYSPKIAEAMLEIGAFLKQNGGALLAVDYGDAVPLQNRIGDTIQALFEHKPVGIFDSPGNSDITAHVSFAALEEIAADTGADHVLTMTQREFLTQFGIRLRAEKLLSTANDNQSETIQSGLLRLIDANQMGDLFKVLQVIYGI